ncbi:hypothetical protein NA56DRAFT_130510 [Hyaloscypha hepaticicola]|uniref:Uncharacterized protein n=1 Tax=Hyaloscypha hepaticicola TaxID=2082293 RepID=A0A2J6Q465_9HELO|nr:hypothetical protein NA56DRAFT_130510 [Hyaloscypha hepaticicola]
MYFVVWDIEIWILQEEPGSLKPPQRSILPSNPTHAALPTFFPAAFPAPPATPFAALALPVVAAPAAFPPPSPFPTSLTICPAGPGMRPPIISRIPAAVWVPLRVLMFLVEGGIGGAAGVRVRRERAMMRGSVGFILLVWVVMC